MSTQKKKIFGGSPTSSWPYPEAPIVGSSPVRTLPKEGAIIMISQPAPPPLAYTRG